MSEWTVSSNDAVSLSLVRSSEDKQSLAEDETYENFHPSFTYPIYGEEETIYGYKDLAIDVKFASGSLAQYVSITYRQKLPASTVDDPEATLKEFIPPDYLTDETTFQKRVAEDATSFNPLGERIYSYNRPSPSAKGKGKGIASTQALDPTSEDTVEYEVYHATFDTPGFREYHRRMQLFILLYIEGGSYINEDEEGWEFMVLVATYHFAGYTSLYSFYHYPEKIRLRLSQFVILTPYQRGGHGSELYKSVYQCVVAQPHIAELSVEDPAEAFEDLRDKNDLQMLLAHEKFMEEGFGDPASYGGGRVGGVGRAGRSGMGGGSHAVKKGKMGPPTDKAWAEKWRKDLKLAGRQFQRLVEMLVLYKTDILDAKAQRAYRLQVKERLYRFNFEILAQLEKEERHEKLEETFKNVKEDYYRILAKVK
ncbi:histone acetyltransferase type B catalytic subunit [Coprinopsis sp. MPI-PUGE-AT-0042]|nr:histone acetyltransferase type B catalytic subunit [Coprinopsis sp. MPI-PUGE-AT-0042]